VLHWSDIRSYTEKMLRAVNLEIAFVWAFIYTGMVRKWTMAAFGSIMY
jgi:hypothetical protein